MGYFAPAHVGWGLGWLGGPAALAAALALAWAWAHMGPAHVTGPIGTWDLLISQF